jgi:hypothetical protein
MPDAACDGSGVGGSRERTKPGAEAAGTTKPPRQQINTMNSFAKLSLVATVLCSALIAEAGNVRGYYRSNGTYVAPHYRSDSGSFGNYGVGTSSGGTGYVYRNPYAAYPSVKVREYTRDDGTMVLPHRRTPANDRLEDNLNYRGNGSLRVPKSAAPSLWLQPVR